MAAALKAAWFNGTWRAASRTSGVQERKQVYARSLAQVLFRRRYKTTSLPACLCVKTQSPAPLPQRPSSSAWNPQKSSNPQLKLAFLMRLALFLGAIVVPYAAAWCPGGDGNTCCPEHYFSVRLTLLCFTIDTKSPVLADVVAVPRAARHGMRVHSVRLAVYRW